MRERSTTMRTIFASVLAAVILATAAPAQSFGRGRVSEEVSVEIVSDQGSSYLAIPYKEFQSGSTRVAKKYLEAKRGENYGIVIRNMTPERLGVVVAVDGRNIISGKSSELGNTEDMYIVEGYGRARYDGWRTDKDTVHRFYFTEPADSYSVRTFADSSAMGVIAVAIYREKERPRRLEELQGAAPAAPSMEGVPQRKSKALADESAGTGFGNSQYSPTIRVAFEPHPLPLQKILLKYEWHETLCRKGILSCGRETGNRLWDPDGYAPYPPGYRE
jgi:hypothetical protein